MNKPPAYKIKYQPNLFDLAIMDGYLYGGNGHNTVQREIYWKNQHDGVPQMATEYDMEATLLDNMIRLPHGHKSRLKSPKPD